ncbi:unnamed protein product [Parajaminaea phylloscopi]
MAPPTSAQYIPPRQTIKTEHGSNTASPPQSGDLYTAPHSSDKPPSAKMSPESPPQAFKQEISGTPSSSRLGSPRQRSDTPSASSIPTSLSPHSAHVSQTVSSASTSLLSSSSPRKLPLKAMDDVAEGSSTPSATTLHPPPQVEMAPAPGRRRKKADNAAEFKPQIIDYLPRAEDEALASFARLEENWYANKWIGRSKGHDQGLVCECSYRPGRDDISRACTDEAGCINRLTQVECTSAECNCKTYCQNQRFQRKEYAQVEIVKTEKKGYGLRAAEDVAAESFVYEYIGEVVEEADFRKRMQRYHEERIPHFYFMMLQRDEYLDATKRGDVARFINHSCNPNCYVAKWHVGKHMRMGIFSQRDIIKGEELTFNYNVDRYGNEAQPCYCGEPNCVGQLGGKTQTDIGGMSNLYIEALGIVDEVERLQARGSRKQKSRILDEDFTPTLHAMEDDEVPTVATAIRQAASNRSILTKLLSRIDMTPDVAVQKRFVRLHGFVLMAGVLTEWKDDKDVLLLVMRILAKWPLIARNKVVDTGVEGIVQTLIKNDDDDISSLAADLYEAWQQLSLEFRIARKDGREEGCDDSGAVASDGQDGQRQSESERHQLRRRFRDDEDPDDSLRERMDYALDNAQAPNDVSATLNKVVPRPLGKAAAASASVSLPSLTGANRFIRNGPRGSGWGRIASANRVGLGGTPGTPQTPDETAGPVLLGAGTSTPPTTSKAQQPAMSIEEIIRRANEASEAEAKRANEEAAAAAADAAKAEEKRRKKKQLAASGSVSSRNDRPSSSSLSRKRKGLPGGPSSSSSSTHPNGEVHSDDKKPRVDGRDGEADRALNKKLHILVSEVIVKVMSPHRSDPSEVLSSKDSFKRHARELTDLVCEKERRNEKSWPPKDGQLEKLSGEKREKIRTFAESYIRKLIEKKRNAAPPVAGSSRDSDAAGTTATPMDSSPRATPAKPVDANGTS